MNVVQEMSNILNKPVGPSRLSYLIQQIQKQLPGYKFDDLWEGLHEINDQQCKKLNWLIISKQKLTLETLINQYLHHGK